VEGSFSVLVCQLSCNIRAKSRLL